MKATKAILLLTFLAAFTSFSQSAETNVIYIPNIFTPNGDGINDVFRVDASGYEELIVTIYNRHGEQVYRYEGLNGSWDGFTHAGVKVSPGVYFVFAEVTNGGEILTDQETLQVQY